MGYPDNNIKKQTKKKKESNKIGTSTYEEFEQIKFQFYELSQQINDQNSMMQNQNFKITPDSQFVQIPIQIWNQLKKQNQNICKDYDQMKDQLINNFDQQIQIHQKQKKKNKHYQKLLRDYENQSMLLMRDQKLQEESFKDLTKKHNINNYQIDQVLNNIEFQVQKKKLQVLSKQNKLQLEQKLDNAFSKMINSENLDFEIDNVFNEFIHILRSFGQINFPSQSIQEKQVETAQTQRNELSNNELQYDCNSKVQRQKTPNIPKLPIERISIAPGRDTQQDSLNRPQQTGKNPKQRATMRTNRGSSRQYSQASQRSQKAQVAVVKQNEPLIINEAEEKEESVIITNPVMVGVMNKTSKFEHKYEDDYDGANVTLDMQTERLKQFPEEYEMLMNIQDPDQRILLKQQVFFIYEKLLRKQAKQEKKRRKKEKKEIMIKQNQEQQQVQEKQNQVQDSIINKIQANKIPNDKSKEKQIQQNNNLNQDLSSASSKVQNQIVNNRYNGGGLGMNERHADAIDISQIVTSRFSLQSELPSIDTQEIISAQKRYRALDVNQSEIIDLEISVNGLKTATQKSLIKKIDEEFRQKEILKKQFKDNEAKMNYSSSVVSKINSGSNYDNYDQMNKDGNYNSNNYFSNDNKRNEKLIWIAESDSNRSASDQNNQVSYSLIDQDDNINKSRQLFFEQNKEKENEFLKSNQSDGLNQINYEKIDPSVKNPQSKLPPSQKISKSSSNHSKANSMSSQKKFDLKDLIKDQKNNIDGEQQQETKIETEGQYKNNQIHYINKFENAKQTDKKNKKKDQPCFSQRNFIVESIEKDQHLEVIQERLSEFSLSLITNAARLNSHRSRQSKTNINQYENQGSIVNKKGTSVNFSSITVNSNNQQNNQLNRQESLSYINESAQKQTVDKDAINREMEDIHKKINFRSVSYQVLTQNDNDFYSNHYNSIEPIKVSQKEIIKVDNQKQKQNRQNVINNENLKKMNKINQDLNLNKIHSNQDSDNLQKELNTDRTNSLKFNQYSLNIEQKSLSHRQNITGSLIDQKENIQQQHFDLQNKGFSRINIPNIENNHNQIIEKSLSNDRSLSELVSNPEHKSHFEQNIKQQQQLQEIVMPSKTNYQLNKNQILQKMDISQPYNGEDILIGQVDLNNSLENLDQHNHKLIGNQEVYNTQESIGRQILRVAHEKPQESLIRSSSECQLRDKEFYDMCDDEDEIVMYCKLAEQSILDAIHMRHLSDYQHNGRIKVPTTENDPFRNSITQNQIDFAQNYSQSLHKLNFIQRQQNSSQNPNNQMIFMSQKTMNKMYNRYLQTQDKTQLLIGKQFANNIIDNAASATVDKNSSQQQTRGKATFNRIMLGGGISSIQGGLLKFPQQNLNQNINSSNYLGTNLLLTSFNDCTLPFCHNIMMPTHQYNRRTLLMMQNLHNNYLYSANSGILFTQRGWNSGLAAQMTSDNGSYVGRLGTKIGQSLKNLGNIENLNREMTSGIIERDSVENDLRGNGDKLNQGKNNYENKMIDTNTQQKNQEISLLSGEPINISNFIFGAKQQTKDQKNQSCITIVDDDCKLMIDRKLLQEAKNQSHQMKFRNLFSQSKTSAKIPFAQQSSCDFSQQQTEHIQNRNLNLNHLKGINSQTKQTYPKKFDFKCNEQLIAKKVEILEQKAKIAENQIKYKIKQDELQERGNQQKIILKKKEKTDQQRQLEDSIILQKNFCSIDTSQQTVNKHNNDLTLKMQKSSSLEQNNKLKKMNGNTKILNLITGLKQIQEKQNIKKLADSNNNTMNIIQILDQQKKQRALKMKELSEDRTDIDNRQKLQEKLLIASGISRSNNNSVQIIKRKIKSSLSYQNESLEKQQLNTVQDYCEKVSPFQSSQSQIQNDVIQSIKKEKFNVVK